MKSEGPVCQTSLTIYLQVSLDLIAQHCTLLPPELVSLGQVATFIGAGDQDAANNNLDTMDTTPAHIKEVRLLLLKYSLVFIL